MPISPDDLLARVARTIRDDVAPAVGDEFAKTQAFMAAVILTKLAGQLRARDEDAAAAERDRRMLVGTLRDALGGSAATPVDAAVDALEHDGTDASWSRIIRSLYEHRDEIGAPAADDLLDHVRTALRHRLDRALVYSA